MIIQYYLYWLDELDESFPLEMYDITITKNACRKSAVGELIVTLFFQMLISYKHSTS